MAAEDTAKLGINGAVYRNTGTENAPTWVEVKRVRNVQPSFPWDMVLLDSRESRAKQYGATQVDPGAQIEVRASNTDEGYLAILDASETGEEIDLLILNGKLTEEGSRGMRASWLASCTGETQGVGDAVYDSFDLKPGITFVPKRVVVGAAESITETDW